MNFLNFLILLTFLPLISTQEIQNQTTYIVPYNKTCYTSKLTNLINKNSTNSQIFDLARDLCTDNLDRDLSEYFKGISGSFPMTPINKSENVKNCLKFNLLSINARGAIVDSIDRKILESFKVDENCEEMIRKINEMPPGVDECTKKAPLFHGLAKAALLAASGEGEFSKEAIEAERKGFIEETKFQWEFHLNCLIQEENKRFK